MQIEWVEYIFWAGEVSVLR